MNKNIGIAVLALAVLSIGCIQPNSPTTGQVTLVKEQIPATGLLKTVEAGDTIEVEYTGLLDDGSVFDQTPPNETVSFSVGVGQLIQGFDEALIGMKEGETKNIVIPPAKAYGEVNNELFVDVNYDQLAQGGFPIEPGIKLRDELGRPVTIVTADQNANKVVLNYNHPLAGKTLHFQVTITKISKKK
ncbi:MAG: FKBP-type peptidyl-prolyl cis-trans isomerase [Candidatus Diapherotrites archaeon]|nr:FKBP-type peptidyl-prolyl cis-trans isomerase [Candidatus Diapherotrites archaeon]